jgi:hypothetical protein
MAARIRTLNFLPEVFRTPTNAQFLGATLDQVVDQPNTMRIQGYIGSKFGYGINAKDKYVVEPTKIRTDYQLDSGVVFTKTNTAIATDFITYPGIIDALKLNGGVTNNNDRLFNSQFYSWDPFINLDMLINFNQYYWLPEGPPSVTIATDIVYNIQNYIVNDNSNSYLISSDINPAGSSNPVLTLIRGGTYTFAVDQSSQFWIQGKPGVTGFDPQQPNVQTRDVYGVSNNGIESGVVTFNVPFKNAEGDYNFPGDNTVDLVATAPFDSIQGQLLSDVEDIDGVTSLAGLTVMFYNTGDPNEQDYSGNFYQITYSGDLNNPTISLNPYGLIPINEKITINFGTQWKARNFYKNSSGSITLIPYLSSLLDTLYYQDGSNPNKVGIIKLIDSNITNQINVLDILGEKNYTAPNGVVFTNGLKVTFDGSIFPESYKTGEYYVQGVGTAIELINTTDLIVPEPFSEGIYVPYDTAPYDIGNYDITLYVPVKQDYITIARNCIDRNPWSRSNRWFHVDVINSTATYNNDPSIVTTYATQDNKAKRPIIEFYPNLKLFDNCIVGKKPIDFFDSRTTDAFNQVAGQTNYYPDVEIYTSQTATINSVVSGTSTTITINSSDVFAFNDNNQIVAGVFQVGQYITDTLEVLPRNAQITSVTGTNTLTITVEWENPTSIVTTTGIGLIANDIQNNNFSLFDGARIVFSADTNPDVKNKIYTVRLSTVTGSVPTITLTEAEDGLVLENEGTFAFRGYYNQGKDFYYYFNDDPTVLANQWKQSQQKTIINQAPYFDIFDNDGISFGNKTVYVGSSFTGNKLFSYGIGIGVNDAILGFPLRYSSVNNVGDISFDVPLNSETFTYVRGQLPETKKVNTGYVFNYSDLTTYTRALGWQTAVAESRQYQIFSFNYIANSQTTTYTCDIAAATDTVWPNIQVYVNNVLRPRDSYTYEINENNTVITFTVPNPYEDTVVEIALLSDQVSATAYYQIPNNLQNNPFNEDITAANVGDIRGQYQSIFYNNPDTTGTVFGANNYRDLGNLVPWGNRIIQNSASLVLPGTFLRKPGVNLSNALQYNSNQYILFKTLLMDTINNTEYNVYQTPAMMLDDALDQITESKVDTAPFFWSDMLPGKSTFITNSYSFSNSLDVSRYPLSRIYDFTKANYYGVLVYLTRTVNDFTTVTQLIKDVDYTVSTDSPSLTIDTDLLPGDIITIKEYNQTYGSYVPNTPTKLGLYPSFIPAVVLDENYTNPTYFIRGHDGSYTKLYGEYIDGNLIDFRDKVLLEFEKRIYNNLKLSNVIPIRDYNVVPGFFRDSDYSYDEFMTIYSQYFLNWVGENRVEYKEHIGYTPSNEFSFNYNQSGNKIDKSQILQGYWRGVYQYFYDTSQPDVAPWEMIGFADKPTWWENRYGPAPYTCDNLVLWGDLAAGINWNNGDPVVIPQCVRPELLQVIPVDSSGNLLSPFDSIVGNYNDTTFRNAWKVGDVAPTEFAYRRSSSWPFDLMKIMALTKPAQFYNLGVDIDNYKYNEEFNQFLVNDRSHLVISDVEIYGNGTAKTSYINWIVDYEKQVGIDSTQTTTDLLDNLDVRLIYRVAGFTDKTLINFYVEKGTPNSRNASLLIPSESLNVLLYDNTPFNKIVYSGVIVQNSGNGWKVYGNSQTKTYFTVSKPKINGNYKLVTIEGESVQLAIDYFENSEILVPYGTEFVSKQDLAQFLASYGNYLQTQGVQFDEIESGIDINWQQMAAEFLYWTQSGWGLGSIINLNPAANAITIDKDSCVVQPLTLQRQNFILNQNLYPIQAIDLSVTRDGTAFNARPLNQGDTVAYGQFNITNFEHGIVFDNVTLFNDVLYNLVTGLRQNRIFTRGTKTAEWNGTIDAQGFILNQDNIQEWNNITKYTKGSIVKYKNKYWVALKVLEPSIIFDAEYWKETDYDEIQKGLLPNPSTRSYESTLYYDTNTPNLNKDSDLLSWSLIGYRPRDYLALADLTDITQINVYKNMIKEKGTRVATENFRGIQLPQGGIDYDVYESWAIKTGEFGGVLDNNFIDFKLNQSQLTANPSIVGLTTGTYTDGVQQEVPLYSIFNYGRPITNPNVLPTLPTNTPNKTFPDAGYVNFNDITTFGYYYNDLNTAQTPLSQLYVGEYVWIADYQGTWQVYTPISNGVLIQVVNNLDNTVTLEFAEPHGLSKYETIAIINFNDAINGYRVVQSVVDNYKVVVPLSLVSSVLRLTGSGIVMRFQSQRINQPSDAINLPLLNTEFVKNKIWVDTDTTGDWAVYRKGINYSFSKEITKDNSSKLGSAVATTNTLGYLVADNGLGKVYRYIYNPVFDTYEIRQELTGGSSFGTSISYSGSIFAISQPTGTLITDRKIKIYNLIVNVGENRLDEIQTILAPDGVTNWGTKIEFSGDGNWLFISAHEQNLVYVYRKSQLTDLYEYSTVLTVTGLATGDNFSYSLATNYYGNTVAVGAPGADTGTTNNTGKAFIFERLIQNFEAQYTSQEFVPQTFNLVFNSKTQKTVATAILSDAITLDSVIGISINMPVVFTGTVFGGIQENKVYYIQDISGSTIKLSLTRDGAPLTLVDSSGTMNANVQTEPLYVSVNGTLISDINYAVIDSSLVIYRSLTAGDIITASGSSFVMVQEVSASGDITIGQQYGYSADLDTYGNELLVGSPYQINTDNKEGVIYRYTDGGGKYGIIIGTSDCQLTNSAIILLNGYAVTLPAGNASVVAGAIVSANVTNITASAINNKLVISLVNANIATINDKIDIAALDTNVLSQLGLYKYTLTQQITDPHPAGRTQFGTVIKFNNNGSFVTSAPVSARYQLTTFDSTDDENYNNDTLFDNNTTQFLDIATNAGAVYMFDYLGNYNENLNNVGNFVYAQSVNALNIEYGSQPYYGTALDFNDNKVIIGTPNFRPGFVNGQVIVYENQSGQTNWSVYRKPQQPVDINGIQNAQLYSASTNNTLINLDYFDPLQGKLLGVVAQNLDIISNADPASYNSPDATQSGSIVWGAKQVGQLWFDTSTTKFVNYHQYNDVVYNSKWWGRVFPGSNVAIYSWITSNVLPLFYTGPGTPRSLDDYSIEYVLNSTGAITPVYFYWVRNTNIVFNQIGKTLSDTVCESYISAPQSTGISYFAPLQSNVMGLYNSGEYINSTDTVMHIGFATGTNDDVSHSAYSLIRDGFFDDFLPGIPGVAGVTRPESLYGRMLDSMSGVDEAGAVVPDPYLPKPVQSGILARPRQSFFYNRFGALKNYLTYANELLKQQPFVETSLSYSFLTKQGEINPSTGLPFYDTKDYWEYVNWWAPGYNDSTRAATMVDYYYQLATINAQNGLIVSVKQNGDGLQETYRYDSTSATWVRIGLQNGTIQFKSSLWDYETARLGFGDNFFDTTPFDVYPSEETRNIVRFLNEDTPEEFLFFRNKGLILLFNYIISETIESQNYIPWLNKTSFIDVAHTIRELVPLEVYQSDNQDFLAGYINEVKPYHVVVKDFLFKYTGIDLWAGNITDFDLPAQYNTSLQQYITPELVFANPSSNSEFLPTNAIWENPEYNNWYNNYGVSITGVENYPIAILSSYLTLNSTSLVVDNVYGFPINGVIKVYDPMDPETDLTKKAYELIAYSSVDRAYGTLNGLTRGINGSTISTHLPGQQIYIDLPAVLVLNGGRGYATPPKITAYIDTTLYPAPRREAILRPVMGVGTLLSVEVVDPGEGYVVLPEIVIEPSDTITFSSSDVDLVKNTIAIQSQILETGDLVKYVVGSDTTAIGGVKNDQYYYINVLETVPNFVIALYTSYADALQDRDRVVFLHTGIGSNNTLEISARASCITNALPIRENVTTLRYDRTSYTSRVLEWIPGNFYGSFYAGSLLNSEQVASSSISIAPPEFGYEPPINDILASAQGATFEIQNIRNDETITWSSLTRNITGINSVTDVITLTPFSSTESNASGSTIGFYVGMPVKFEGSIVGNIVLDYTYYITEIISETEFKINLSMAGTVLNPAGLTMYVGEVTNTGVVTIQYPGILTATKTEKTTNYITLPLTTSGKYGTTGFYTGLPVFFTGSTFGNIVENENYYVASVVDNQTFTISTNSDPTQVTVEQTEIIGNFVKLDDISDLQINTPVIITNMVISGSPVTNFGGIISGAVYYIASIDYGLSKVTLSATFNGGPITITSDVVAAPNTYATLVSQSDAVQLTNATGTMSCNVGLPISPGQINGQKFTFYKTSGEFTNSGTGYTGSYSNLITRETVATVSGEDYLYLNVLTGGLENLYVNMPFKLAVGIGGLVANTTYYVESMGSISSIEVTSSSSFGNKFSCNSTAGFYPTMPISFVGGVFGFSGIESLVTYYIESVVSNTEFTISESPGGAPITLVTDIGLMLLNGDDPWITVKDNLGTHIALTDSTTATTLTQNPTSIPYFYVNYILGGYSVIIKDPGEGFAYNNNITLLGSNFGGINGLNDVIVNVSGVGSNGQITSTIISGTPPGLTQECYLKVISPTELEVYANDRMTIPVSGTELLTTYSGVVSTTVTALTNPNITVTSTSGFEVNDPVVFTGDVVGNIVLGQTYYIKTITPTLTISETVDGTVFDPGTLSGLNFTMAKTGDYVFLFEPFEFEQSIVRYNNRLYQCIVSNNDTEFIIGKWEPLDSGSRILNALDRIIGYYNPTVNMPGRDLTQLVSGVTFPGSSYLGNAFEPVDQFALDTELQDQPFYPATINNKAILWDGATYISATTSSAYSALINSMTGNNWTLTKLSNNPVNLTDIAYANGRYVITTSNPATPIYTSTNGVVYTTGPSLTVPSNSLTSVYYGSGVWIAVGENLVRSTNTLSWTENFNFGSSSGYLTDVTYVNIGGNYIGWLAIGNRTVNGNDKTILLESTDNGLSWNIINENVTTIITDAYVNALTSGNGIIVIVADNGRIFTSTNGCQTNTEQTSGTLDNINDIIYGNGYFVAVGDNGLILTSTDGSLWTTRTSSTTNKLNAVIYNSTDSKFITVGENNTILISSDNGVTWVASASFIEEQPVYTVQGGLFTDGYGPEELVPGIVTDNLSMIVNTRPGTNWPVGQYGHTGFNVVSVEITPSYPQTLYSFLNLVENPAFIALYDIDPSVGLSTRIYEGYDYSIDWVLKTITLNTTLAPNHILGINLYEVGNGDQLERSNSQAIPLITNPVSGFTEIPLTCNYSANRFNGNGVIRPSTEGIQIECTETESGSNTITCSDVSIFSLNIPIKFQGGLIGGIEPDQVYYVKNISYATNKITVALPPLVDGIAGPVYELTDATGSMYAVIQEGTGLVWTDPLVVHNGTELVLGEYSIVTQTKSGTNSIVANTSVTLDINDPIVFCNCITFTGVLTPFTTYYISSIVDDNEFTVSETIGGSTIVLQDTAGFSAFVTNDYAVTQAPVGTKAQLVFADQYTQENDFITFALFGETEPVQYSYSIPETQIYEASGGETQLYLINYIGGENPENAVVELNGLRLTYESDYFIDGSTQILHLTSSLTLGDLLAITTYNSTERQYLHTIIGGSYIGANTITLNIGSSTHFTGFSEEATAGSFIIGTTYQITSVGTTDFTLIGAASNTVGEIFTATGPGAGTGTAGVGYGDVWSPGPDYLTLSVGDTSDLVPNMGIIFEPVFGVIEEEVTYYISEIIDSTSFSISLTPNGAPLSLTNATGSMIGYISPAIVSKIVAVNNVLSTPLAITSVTGTTAPTTITCGSTNGFVVGQPVLFKNPTATGFGGISADGVTYWISNVLSSTEFEISKTQGGSAYTVTTDTGAMYACVGGNETVTITTQDPHTLVNNNLVRIDGTLGSVQLNNNTYYVRVVSNTELALYNQPYQPENYVANDTVTNVSNYLGGGYVWIDKQFTLTYAVASATSAIDNTITVNSTEYLEIYTPVYFSGNVFGNVVEGARYYVNSIDPATKKITISETYRGEEFVLSTASGSMGVSMWEQGNVDRIWVTINGYRVPSSSLYINENNNLSILTTVNLGDIVIITTMIPTASPNALTYINNVNRFNIPTVYRANTLNTTWLTNPLRISDSTIYVEDVSKITTNIVQNETATIIGGICDIGLDADKHTIAQIIVVNNTTSTTLASSSYNLKIVDTAPVLEITSGVSNGDSLTVTIILGNLIYIAGEQIKYTIVDFDANTLSGLQRGTNGTSARDYVPTYEKVYGILSDNLLSNLNYHLTWNSYDYNPTLGDPLQISTTSAANFLNLESF